MSVSIVTFANLGDKENLPTADILPVINKFIELGELGQIICQLNKNFTFPNTRSAVPAVVRYPVRLLQKIFPSTVSRRTEELLVDFFAQYRLQKHDAVIFHGGYFLSRTLQKALANSSITVDITMTAHVQTNANLEQEEFGVLGVSGYEGVFTRLAKESSHLNKFDYVIAISDFVKRSYIANGYPEDRIFTAELDIDIERFSPRPRPLPSNSPFRVVYTAYTKVPKGLHYLLDAWESLKLSDAELVIVGGFSDMPDSLKEWYMGRIRNNSSIKWIGNADKPEEYYREASVFAFPSITEGFPKVVIEAMACGLPVITTENAQGIVSDGKTGFVVPIRDSVALADKIKYLYDNREVAEQMGVEARRAVENKKSFGQSVYEIYQEILRREHDK